MRRENIYMMGKWKQRGMLIGKWARRRLHLLTAVSILILIGAVFLAPVLLGAKARSNEQFSISDAWTTYLADNQHDGYNSHETVINPSSAPSLKQKWAHTAGNGVSDQPIESNGVVYWGSWDGYAHATNVSTNARIWSRFIGQTSDSACNPPLVGVASSPTLTIVNGQSAIVVGGGDAHIYALSAATGTILWSTSLGSSPSTFIWDSPTVSGTSVYIGTSSFGDCPLVQSKVFKLDVNTGAIQNTFKVVPDGCTGGGVWGSPTVDELAGKVYFTTGNNGSCGSSESNAFALVELNALDLSFVARWQAPSNQVPGDSDFGSTPTLFTKSTGTLMVGIENKNGKFYALNRTNISAGPLWTAQVANAGDCPQCGGGSISPAAWDGTSLYIGGGNATINGTSCKGGVRKVNPDNGSFIWSHCMGAGPVLGAVTIAGPAPGPAAIVAAAQGNTVIVMNASSGVTLARLSDAKSGSLLYGPPTISDGVLFQGNLDGNIYAYSVNGV